MKETLSIVVEGTTDAMILRKTLPSDTLSSTKFYSASGGISLASVGRNILVHEGGPVMLIRGADTFDAEKARKENALILATLRQISFSGNFDVFSFLPSIEIVFFEEPKIIENILGQKIPENLLFDAEIAPKKVLDFLRNSTVKLSLPELIKKISDTEAKSLRKGKQLKELVCRIRKLM
jgi:hypothetical protein